MSEACHVAPLSELNSIVYGATDGYPVNSNPNNDSFPTKGVPQGGTIGSIVAVNNGGSVNVTEAESVQPKSSVIVTV